MINIIIGLLIFGYAAYSLAKFVQRGKKGKCVACSMEASCPGSSCNDIGETM